LETGSAADALHLAAELVVRLRTERAGLGGPGAHYKSLSIDCGRNDYGFETDLSRQIESLVARNDTLVALSTSGNSPNVIRGVEADAFAAAYLVGFTGDTGGQLAGKVDLLLNVPRMTRSASRNLTSPLATLLAA